MVENSTSSTQAGKRRTSRTEPLTPEQALEILQQAVRECQQAGIKTGVSTLYRAGCTNVVIIALENVSFCDGNLVLATRPSE